MKKTLATIAVLVLVATAACGGGGRPSEDELAKVFKEGTGELSSLGKITDKAADCMAEAFHDSDVSDAALQAIVDKNEDYEPSKDDEKALEKTLPKMMKCVPGMQDLQKQMDSLDPEELQEQLENSQE